MNSLSSKQQLLHLLQIQPLELHQEFSAMAKRPETEAMVLEQQVADTSSALMETFGQIESVYIEPDVNLAFAKDLLLAFNEYQPDLQWRVNPASTEPMLQNGLLVTPSIELLQSAQQKKLLWLCLQQES